MAVREDVLDDLDYWYNFAEIYKHLASTHRSDAWNWFGVGNDHKALEEIIKCCQDLITTFTALIGDDMGYAPYAVLPYFCRFHTIESAGEVTMRAILDEMFSASNEELLQFIALVDAYRQSLWNKPFDAEYWAAVARGFEKWE